MYFGFVTSIFHRIKLIIITGHHENPRQEPRVQDVCRQGSQRQYLHRRVLRITHHPRDGPRLPSSRPEGPHRRCLVRRRSGDLLHHSRSIERRRGLEPVDRKGKGYGRLWARRGVPEDDLCRGWFCFWLADSGGGRLLGRWTDDSPKAVERCI